MGTGVVYWYGRWCWRVLKGGLVCRCCPERHIGKSDILGVYTLAQGAESTKHRGKRRDEQVGDNPDVEQRDSETLEVDGKEARESWK